MGAIKTIDDNGKAFLKQVEGFRTKPYLDSKGIPTISVGVTHYPDGTKVTLQDAELSEDDAWELFENVLDPYEHSVWLNTMNNAINQNQFNALVSICYNIGIKGFRDSTFLKKIKNNPSDPSIKKAILLWNKPPEIVGRRNKEVALYFK